MISIVLFGACQTEKPLEAEKWEKVVLSFNGPESAEDGTQNPFTDFRLDVTFTNGAKTYVVPGFFAADGNAE